MGLNLILLPVKPWPGPPGPLHKPKDTLSVQNYKSTPSPLSPSLSAQNPLCAFLRCKWKYLWRNGGWAWGPKLTGRAEGQERDAAEEAQHCSLPSSLQRQVLRRCPRFWRFHQTRLSYASGSCLFFHNFFRVSLISCYQCSFLTQNALK